MSWVNVNINKNQVKYDTGSASLIKLPGSEDKIWVPNKCIREGAHRAALNVGFNEDWSYHAVRGKTIKFEISGEDVIEAFRNMTVVGRQEDEIERYEHFPMRIKSKGVKQVDPSLIR